MPMGLRGRKSAGGQFRLWVAFDVDVGGVLIFELVSATAIACPMAALLVAVSSSSAKVVSTDPPYYDNIGYADLSDFFYVWLRRSLKSVFPTLFATVAVPKAEELVATPDRHGKRG